ncbi:MAG TPA: hypothetical protein ENG96_00525 [Gammaproteobacteria bacterium]|nr:hypothetical protein [Gammaproteobacteria bacterium]
METENKPIGSEEPVATFNPQLKATRMTTDLVLIIIAIAVPVVSWVFIPFGGESHWFGRSGTIMAIIGIMLESRLFASKLIMFELTQLPGQQKGISSYRYVMSKGMAIVSHIILITGALISGYGDLFFAGMNYSWLYAE